MKAKLVEDFKNMPPKTKEQLQASFNNIVGHIEEIKEKLNQGNPDVTLDVDEENFVITVSHHWTRSEDDFDDDFDLSVELEVDFLNDEIRGSGKVTHDDLLDWSYDYDEKYGLYGTSIESLIESIGDANDQVAGSIEYSGEAFEEARGIRDENESDDDEDEDEGHGQFDAEFYKMMNGQ